MDDVLALYGRLVNVEGYVQGLVGVMHRLRGEMVTPQQKVLFNAMVEWVGLMKGEVCVEALHVSSECDGVV